MQANRGRDTAPELAVRRRLHATGLRYRVDTAPEPGRRRRADIVFPKQRIATFIDEGFCAPVPWARSTQVATNALSCSNKIATKARPDLDTRDRLERAGWTVLRCRQHHDPADVAAEITRAVKP